jgi:hypothetical protein
MAGDSELGNPLNRADAFSASTASWLNIVEILFGITREAVRRGTFTSVPDLIGAIRTFVDACNQCCQPFA